MTTLNMLTAVEVAARLDVTPWTVSNLLKRGALTGVRHGGRIFITPESVEAMAALDRRTDPKHTDDLVLVADAAKTLGWNPSSLFLQVKNGRLGSTQQRLTGRARKQLVVSLREARELFPERRQHLAPQAPVQPAKVLNAGPRTAVKTVDAHFTEVYARLDALAADVRRVQQTLQVLFTPSEAERVAQAVN